MSFVDFKSFLSSPVTSFFAAVVVVVVFSSFAFAGVVVDDVDDVFDRVEDDFGFSSVFFSGVFFSVVVVVVVFPVEDDSELFVGLLDTDFVLGVASAGATGVAAGVATLDEGEDEEEEEDVSMD